ncbi:MAG: adenine deaminase [bacterium]|nr:MAG: adenine deaminase [bacterium]
MENLARLLAVARGDEKADLVLKNGKVINIFTGEIQKADVAIAGDVIAGLGHYGGEEEIDLAGSYVSPGFIESHFHIESTMLRPSELSRVVVPRGTTCLIADPHEIANVSGIAGIEFILADSEGVPLDLFLMAPSCVPATDFETSGSTVSARDIEHLLQHERVLGLAEVMNYPGVVFGEEAVLRKVRASAGRPIDGHAPLLTGKHLNAYAAAGIQSDHECTNGEEALEKVRLGIRVMIREGTSAHDMEAILPVVTDRNSRRFMLATDDRHADELLRKGHLDLLLRLAVSRGVDPVEAVRMVTINPAEHFRLAGRGAVAPGYMADLVVLKNLKQFKVKLVTKSGRIVARDGVLIAPIKQSTVQHTLLRSIHLKPLSASDLDIRLTGDRDVRVIELREGSLLTGSSTERVPLDGRKCFIPDAKSDLAALYVLERHRGTGRVGKGVVRGFGMKEGAIASSVAHDSHNIICVSMDEKSAVAAVNALIQAGGGLSCAVKGKTIGTLDLPVCGLISERSVDVVTAGLAQLKKAVRRTGCRVGDPFMALSFLALPVIPELKLTDWGLFDVGTFSHVPLEVGEETES